MMLQRRRSWIVPITAVVVGLLGFGIAGLGIWLAVLGGSWYYVVAGALLIVTSVLLGMQRFPAVWVYTALMILTIAWAIRESGLDGWALIPRLIAPSVLGAWIWSPWIAGRLQASERRPALSLSMTGMACCLAIVALVIVAGYRVTAARTVVFSKAPTSVANNLPSDPLVGDEDWTFYGRTPAGDRFSPLGQITRENVAHLTQAWSFSSGDLPRSGENAKGREFSFEATPIKVGDTLYFCTPHRQVIALDATTGELRWRYDPDGDTSHNVYQACRGVSYFEAPPGAACPHRIISTASDLPRLFELDADTGKLCDSFGKDGMVDLREHMGPVPPGFHFITSPPLVLNGRIMLSGWVYDNQSIGEPSGVIRAFDATSGRLAWSWDVGRSPPTKPLGPDETYTRGRHGRVLPRITVAIQSLSIGDLENAERS